MSIASIGVDFGRVVMTHSELQTACDAAARYGAAGLKNVLVGASAASANAVVAAAANKADGSYVAIDPNSDVQLVIWNAANRTYTVTTDPSQANGVRVIARRTAARGNAVKLMFGMIFGRPSFDLTCASIAMLNGDQNVQYSVPATSNPFLAAMPAGTVVSMNNPHNSPDYAGSTTSAPRQSPVFASGTTVTPGQTMTFDGVNGSATNDYTDTNRYSADGNTGGTVHNYNPTTGGMTDTDYYNESGLSDMRAPINCLVGVFVSDTKPTTSGTPTPPNLDFGTAAQRDFTSLSPKLQQIFFIGDGRTSTGEVQRFVVPTGATRLYIATWDAYEWNNNIGSFTCTIHNNGTVSLVQ